MRQDRRQWVHEIFWACANCGDEFYLFDEATAVAIDAAARADAALVDDMERMAEQERVLELFDATVLESDRQRRQRERDETEP